MRRAPASVAFLTLLAGCGEEASSPPPPLSARRFAVTIDDVAASTCGTPPELVNGLSRQLVDAINCLRPGTLAEIPEGDVRMLEADRPAFVDARALDALLDAAAEGDGPLVLKWGYRDVALQQLFWRQDVLQGCAVAAPPGLSNHQNGLAVDVTDRGAIDEWGPALRRHGWDNHLPNDRVHFDYQRAEDIGLGSLSLYAFQALWNANFPDEPLPLTGELDAATDAALSEAPIEGFPVALCDDEVPPVGVGPIRGPTVGQAAWRGCEPPAELVEGLSWQVADAMNCLEPRALAPLRLCDRAGCLNLESPPVPEWLATPAHDALLAASREREAPITIRWAFRDVTLQHFFAKAADNIACDSAAPAARSDYNTGLSVFVPRHPTVAAALLAQGFTNEDTALPGIFRYAGPDGEDLTSLNVLAFQELWNLNRPGDPIDADGLIGPQTRGAIERAPIDGFPRRLCGDVPAPDAGPPDDDAGPPPEADGGEAPPEEDARVPAPGPDGGAPGPDDGADGGPDLERPSVERGAADDGCAQGVGGAPALPGLLLALALRRRRRATGAARP
jgi:hypothetical protein